MKSSSLAWSLLSCLAVSQFAAASEEDQAPNARLYKRDDAASVVETTGSANPESAHTVFNGVEVPPMKVLTPENFDAITKDGYWLVILRLRNASLSSL